MYIEAVPNRNSPPAILLRESYRVDGKVKKRTLLNLSDWSPSLIEGLRALLKPFFDTFEDEPFCFQLLMYRNIVVSTTPTWAGDDQGAGSAASASRMVGGRARPTAWNTRPTSPVTGVRTMKCLPSCSIAISCRRSRSITSLPHSGLTPAAARRSSRALRTTRAKNEQNTWPRMAASVL